MGIEIASATSSPRNDGAAHPFRPSSFVLLPSSFFLRPSSFVLLPSFSHALSAIRSALCNWHTKVCPTCALCSCAFVLLCSTAPCPYLSAMLYAESVISLCSYSILNTQYSIPNTQYECPCALVPPLLRELFDNS